ncbi:hypothetical protein [Nocardioides stalactiti]|uniref:hypothetical protein n=1 Tax=Nocardioides stalactiti TaxID=2755356 RepID=UPI0016022CE1|nr:hypothetical protein [Nocardioides stalactiti]
MSENKDESTSSGAGISDDQLPPDLVPGEDNPLAEGLPPDAEVDDLIPEDSGLDGDEEASEEDPDDDVEPAPPPRD